METISKLTTEVSKLAKDAARETLDEGRAKAKELEKSLESEIRRYPLRSVLVAAGIGLMVGMYLARR
jgi:ElaB/YqjD/DUF883 family membrane-anchored ribosome-binding protein